MSILRRAVISTLRATAFELSLRHHWYPHRRIVINSFRHKGYWYHGRRRERSTIEAVQRLLKPGHLVVEVGGHIGYLTIIFAECVGPEGRVVVFEPGPDGDYLKRNTKSFNNVEVESLAVADRVGTMPMYFENLSGQNNSLVPDFGIYEQNAKNAGVRPVVARRDVDVTTLDACGLNPDFIKVDVEGAELMVARGGEETFRNSRPIVLMELNDGGRETMRFFRKLGYRAELPTGEPVKELGAHPTNVFFLPT